MVNVKFHQNFETDEQIYHKVVSMTSKNSGCWKNIKVVKDDNYDIFVILNYPQHNNYDKSKTIVFESETPTTRKSFPKFYKGIESEFLYIHDTENHFNVDVWYHGLSFDEVANQNNFLKNKNFSIINSNINNLPGHIFRNNFINQLSQHIEVDLFGRFHTNIKNYKGSLIRKSDGLCEYKYTFNCENDFEPNYFTEKLLDGIMCECVTFYCGCPNVKNFIDSRSFIELSLTDIGGNIELIKDCIKNNMWQSMIRHIREEKRRLSVDMNILNIVTNILENM